MSGRRDRRAAAAVGSLLAAIVYATAGAGASPALAAPPLPAPEAPRALFALIIGVNASPAADVAPLQYADDDAARYLDLFRALGARTTVLSRLDDNTRRLHPQAAAEAVLPRRAELTKAVASLAEDISQARARGVRSTLYLVYAGHGDVGDAGWYLTLEDARLTGADLMASVVERAGADQSHVIIDACQAYLLALPRGPGGAHRPLNGFVALEAAARAGRVGFLLASSASGESHEWAGFEAGVFSHEVRSGLYGAADADGDGRVTYPEIGAFVARANEAIVNARFRSQVIARAPRDGDLLVDLRGRAGHQLRLDGEAGAAHYLLEDSQGVRVLDFHGTARTPVHLLRPPGRGPLYLRRLSDGLERTVPRVDAVVQMESLPAAPTRTQTRGAAQHAFSQLFTLAFDQTAVVAWSQRAAEAPAGVEIRAAPGSIADTRERPWRVVGLVGVGVGIAAGVAATALELSAHALHSDAPPRESRAQALARNAEIDARNHIALGLALGAVGAATTGALLLLWPRQTPAAPTLEIAASSAAGAIAARWWF